MYLSRALEWMRAVRFGPRTRGRHSRSATRPVAPLAAPQAPSHRPSPDVWGARLVIVHRRRTERQARPVQMPQPQARAEWFPPRDWEAEEAWEATGAMVRPYVALLGASPRSARAGAQADPWEAAPWR